MDLNDKVAFITGGANGQGAEEARRWVAEGGSVVIADIATDAADALAGELGERALAVALDVTDEAAWGTAVAAATERFGGIDVLVNNAGTFRWAPMGEETADGFMRVMSINTLSVFLGMRAVAEVMGEGGGGAIVNIASIAGVRPQGDQSAYVASKWAVRGLSRTAAIELAPLGIRVNTVLPGPIDTEMYRAAMGTAKPVEEGGRDRDPTATTLVGRVGQPDDIASVVLFLASDAAAFITGAEIVVDGGRTLLI